MKLIKIISSSFLLLVMLVIIIVTNRGENKDIVMSLKSLINKEIIFPDYEKSNYIMFDSIYMRKSYNYIIVHYVDETSCTKCKLKLKSWMNLIYEIRTVSKKTISLIFITNLKNNNYAKTLFGNNDGFTVINDFHGLFRSLNEYPKEEILNTFLIDNNNKIKTIGNPLKSNKIRQNYYEIILKDRM